MPLPAPQPKISRGKPLSLAERYLERALDFYTKKKYEDALADLDAAIEVEAHNGELYATRGYIQFEASTEAEAKAAAKADFSRALEIDPRQWLAHYGRALLAFEKEDYQSVLRHIQAAERIVPERPEVLIYKAAAYYYQHKKDEAQQAIDAAQEQMDSSDKRMREARKWARAIKQMPNLDEY